VSPGAFDRNGHLFENEVRVARAAQPATSSIVSKLQGTSDFQALTLISGNFVGRDDVRNSAIRVGKPTDESLVVAGHAGLHDRSPFRS
jgi:hypothetical protein